MLVLTRLIRNTPGLSLKDYLDAKALPLSEPVNWNGNNAMILRPLLRVVNALGERDQEIIRADAERVDRMADEMGQNAITAVATLAQQQMLCTIETRHARALWMFLHDQARFRQAEEVAFFDGGRLGRAWDGFKASAGLGVNRDEAHLKAPGAGSPEALPGGREGQGGGVRPHPPRRGRQSAPAGSGDRFP